MVLWEPVSEVAGQMCKYKWVLDHVGVSTGRMRASSLHCRLLRITNPEALGVGDVCLVCVAQVGISRFILEHVAGLLSFPFLGGALCLPDLISHAREGNEAESSDGHPQRNAYLASILCNTRVQALCLQVEHTIRKKLVRGRQHHVESRPWL